MALRAGLPALCMALALALPGLAAGASPAAAQDSPQAQPYDAKADAAAQFDAAQSRARADGKKVLLVMGANWCHDSRALAGWLETPRFRQLVAEKYELVFVDVGSPQSGEGRNLDLASRYGIEIKSTPTVLILSSEGALLNAKAASKWGNAASRSEDAIYDELAAG
jgi:thiol-disulfide isomerase/thioredoxin